MIVSCFDWIYIFNLYGFIYVKNNDGIWKLLSCHICFNIIILERQRVDFLCELKMLSIYFWYVLMFCFNSYFICYEAYLLLVSKVITAVLVDMYIWDFFWTRSLLLSSVCVCVCVCVKYVYKIYTDMHVHIEAHTHTHICVHPHYLLITSSKTCQSKLIIVLHIQMVYFQY